MGVPDFKRYAKRKSNDNCRPYLTPNGYELKDIERGFSKLSHFQSTRSPVKIDR